MNTNADIVTKFNHLNMKEVLSIKDMVEREDYIITGAGRTTTKYGDAIVLELGTNIIYLPRRFNALSDKDVEILSTGEYLIRKIPLNDDKRSTFCRLEIKEASNEREYYTLNHFNTLK